MALLASVPSTVGGPSKIVNVGHSPAGQIREKCLGHRFVECPFGIQRHTDRTDGTYVDDRRSVIHEKALAVTKNRSAIGPDARSTCSQVPQ